MKNVFLVLLMSAAMVLPAVTDPLSAEQQTHNIQVRSMLKFGGGVPSAKVLDEKGQVLAERSGYADLKTYMEFLQQAVRGKK